MAQSGALPIFEGIYSATYNLRSQSCCRGDPRADTRFHLSLALTQLNP